MSFTDNLILDKVQTLQKIKRIAYQIYEQNYREEEIVLAGIYDKGYIFAELLQKELLQISPLRIELVKIELEKTATKQCEVQINRDILSLADKTIIVTDDVLNTGRTLAYSLKPFLNINIKKLQTAVIIDRRHKLFPISPDYVGYSLATTIKEVIEVNFEDDKFGVYLH